MLIALVFLSSALVVPAYAFISGTTPVNGTPEVQIEGVAGQDTYDSMQYSYKINQWAYETGLITSEYVNPYLDFFNASESLRVGMTAYGEFATNTSNGVTAGIAYGSDAAQWNATESWASSSGYIPSREWIQGWTLSLNYTEQAIPRSLEAWSIYSDFRNPEAGHGVWSWPQSAWSTTTQGVVDFSNKTSDTMKGYMTTSPVQMLYESARLAIARTTVTIYDNYFQEAVAQITFTLVLNKDTKIAIVYKDVKILLTAKSLDVLSGFAFSERYELDLASQLNPGNYAYVHWFAPGDANTGVGQLDNLNTVYQHPLTGSSSYDVLQAFTTLGSGNPNYTFFAAYWPNCTEWSVYNYLIPLYQGTTFTDAILPVGTHQSDMPATSPEPDTTPWVTAQWLYSNNQVAGQVNMTNLLSFLAKGGGTSREIRFVEVFGMTDGPTQTATLPDATVVSEPLPADDANMSGSGHTNQIGEEEQYLLATVFNPIDLNNALFGVTTVNGVHNTQPLTGDGFQWIGLGQSAATTDSGTASMVAAGLVSAWGSESTPLALFDRNDTAFPWSSPVVQMEGSIPYALQEFANATYPNGAYINAVSSSFTNPATGQPYGRDASVYYLTALKGYAFGIYDDDYTGPAQPISGGWSWSTYWWMPSKSPLYEAWKTYEMGDTDYEQSPLYMTNVNGIVTIGGMMANGITRYFNDFSFAISREGSDNSANVTTSGVTGTAPTSNPAIGGTFDYFPVSSWASSHDAFGYTAGYAVISIVQDVNGTRGYSIYGWNGRDTYWAGAWASIYLNKKDVSAWLPEGTVAMILHITYGPTTEYTGPEPVGFTIVKALGTITEFGTNAFAALHAPYPFDRFLTTSWNGGFTLPTIGSYVWWYQKLPTTTTASVQFDP